MKKLAVLIMVLAMVFAFASTGIAVEAGNGWWQPVTLYNSTPTVTTTQTSSTYTFKHPVTSIACDITSVPTATVTFQLVTNMSYTTGFASGSNVNALMSAATYTVHGYKAITDFVGRSFQALVSTPETTASAVNVTCIGVH